MPAKTKVPIPKGAPAQPAVETAKKYILALPRFYKEDEPDQKYQASAQLRELIIKAGDPMYNHALDNLTQAFKRYGKVPIVKEFMKYTNGDRGVTLIDLPTPNATNEIKIGRVDHEMRDGVMYIEKHGTFVPVGRDGAENAREQAGIDIFYLDGFVSARHAELVWENVARDFKSDKNQRAYFLSPNSMAKNGTGYVGIMYLEGDVLKSTERKEVNCGKLPPNAKVGLPREVGETAFIRLAPAAEDAHHLGALVTVLEYQRRVPAGK